MRVIPAPATGFCDGVKRAIAIALEAASRHGGLRTEGPVVHNREVIEFLARHGVSENARGVPLLIRAHGVPPAKRREWREQSIPLVDATCVHVARNQRLAEVAARAGETVLIAGDRHHAEVEAVAGCAGDNCRVVPTLADLENFVQEQETAPPAPVFLLAQTTFDIALFAQMTRALARLPNARAADTICRATHTRQKEAGELARNPEVRAVVVVGGANSANTRRLADAAREAGKPAVVVETAAELRAEDFVGRAAVGLTSGASTPDWAIQAVQECLAGMNDTNQ